MRVVLFTISVLALIAAAGDRRSVSGQTAADKSKIASKESSKAGEKESPAQYTRTKLLKTKVSGSFKQKRLGDILKEFADLVDMKGEQPVMWTYGADFPHAQLVSFECKDKPLDVVLDLLLKKAGKDLGYFVVSKEGDKHDGWVKLTTSGERGYEKGAPTAKEETEASEKLTLAKRLIDVGKVEAAKPVLQILVNNYTKTKAGIEAKEILEKLNK